MKELRSEQVKWHAQIPTGLKCVLGKVVIFLLICSF